MASTIRIHREGHLQKGTLRLSVSIVIDSAILREIAGQNVDLDPVHTIVDDILGQDPLIEDVIIETTEEGHLTDTVVTAPIVNAKGIPDQDQDHMIVVETTELQIVRVVIVLTSGREMIDQEVGALKRARIEGKLIKEGALRGVRMSGRDLSREIRVSLFLVKICLLI